MNDESFPGGSPDIPPIAPVTDPSLLVANLVAEPTIAGNVTRNMQHMVESAAENGTPETILREQQLPVFADIAVFLASDAERGHVLLPTGSGKTVLEAEAAKAIFFGTEPGQPDRPKLLHLVPKLELVDYTRGEYNDEGEPTGGYAKFAPDLTTSPYTGEVKDLSGDVVVMTYDSLRRAVELGVLPRFDAVICDEAHRSLGEKTKAAVDVVTEGAKTIAFTATPDFDELKSVRNTFGEKIHEIQLREAIELGMLSKLQVWSYKTNITLNTPGRAGEFNMDELEPLIRHEARNQAAVKAAANYVSQGQQGLISCIPGEKTQHAKDMADLLNGTEIIDANGAKRNMVARAVSGDMDRDELKAIYKDYREGRIDVLTFVDLLTEGFDAPNAKFMVNLRPTKSPVNAIQRLGRVLRLFKPDSIAQIVEFLDDYEGADSFTAYHALGDLEAPLNNGDIYGGTDEDTERLAAEGRQNPFDMSAVGDMIASCELEVLSELYLGPVEREQQRDVKAGRLITIATALGRIAEQGGRASGESLLNHIGSVMVRGSRYVNTEDLQGVMDRYVTRKEDINPATVSEIITSRLRQAFDERVTIRTSAIEEQLRALATETRKFKAPGQKNESIVWKQSELEQLLNNLLTPFEPGAFQSIFDYYHDNEGQRVPYDRGWFTKSQELAQRVIQERFAAMDTEQRRTALRFGVNSFNAIELIYSRELLEAAGNLKDRYVNRPKR
jgi:superfamily II DNA or RNA helicase